VPASFGTLLLFVLTVSPGFLYLTRLEAHALRPQRSHLLLAAELVTIGSAATFLVAALVTFLFDQFQPGFVSGWVARGHAYFIEHPLLIFLWGASILVASHGVVFVGSLLRARQVARRKERPTYDPAGTVWDHVLGRSDMKHDVLLTLNLADGRRLHGYLMTFSTGTHDERDLALQKPIWVEHPGREPEKAESTDALIVPKDQIKEIAVRYESLG
jgi:hypothetical protein